MKGIIICFATLQDKARDNQLALASYLEDEHRLLLQPLPF